MDPAALGRTGLLDVWSAGYPRRLTGTLAAVEQDLISLENQPPVLRPLAVAFFDRNMAAGENT